MGEISHTNTLPNRRRSISEANSKELDSSNAISGVVTRASSGIVAVVTAMGTLPRHRSLSVRSEDRGTKAQGQASEVATKRRRRRKRSDENPKNLTSALSKIER